MGNTHSVETIHHSNILSSPSKRLPQKLSKPRVGNHGSTPSMQAAGLFGSHSRTTSVSLPPSRSNSRVVSQAHSPEPSTPNAFHSDSVSPAESFPPIPPEPETQPGPPARDWKRRASIFRSKSSQEARRKDKRRQTITVSPEAGDRMSRANSMTWESQREMDQARQLQVDSWLVPGNRQSINYNLMSYESRRLLNLNEDLAACEENSIMSESNFQVLRFQITQNTWKSSHPHQPATTPTTRATSIPRANSDVSLYAPVRRRSMVQTPGVATRIPSASDFAASRRSSFRHSMPTTPACGRSRLNSIEGGFMALDEFVAEPDPLPELLPPPPQEPIERALTPSDMDYRPLGAMKFGSLHITNGAASPIPSPDLEPPEDHRAVAEQLGDVTSEKEYGTHVVDMTVSPIQPSGVSKVPSPIEIALLGADPPSLSANSPVSPALEVASKTTAMDDELFEDDVQLEYSAEILTVRNDPNAKPSLEQLQADQSKKQCKGVARADSGVVTSPTTEYQPKPLAKADSGYSSNVSLRSFHAKQNAPGKDQPIHVTAEETEKCDSHSSAIAMPTAGHINTDQVAINADISDAVSSTPPPFPSKDDYLASPSSATMTITSPRHLQFFNLTASSFRWDRKPSVSFDMAQVSEAGPTSPGLAQSAQTVQSNGPVPETPNAPTTTGNSSQRPSKLQRFLSGSGKRGTLVVHTSHPVDESIPSVPSVPQNIQAKLDEPSGRFPLSSKRLTLRNRESKDTLKTILSVGSVDTGQLEDRPDPCPVDRQIIVRKSVPPAADAVDIPKTPKTPKTPHRLSFSIAQAATSIMPRRSIHRKPVSSVSIENAELVVQDGADEIRDGFESSFTAISSVGESVGKSAFDQAFVAMPREESTRRSTDRTFAMTAQMERNMEMHLRAHGQMPPLNGNRLPSPQSYLFPESVESFGKRKTSPPVSLHTRSGKKNLRKPAPLRPKSSSSSEDQQRRQSLSRQNSRESIHSYPSASPRVGSLDDALAVPPVPPLSPRRYSMLEQQYAIRRQAAEDKWRPTNQKSVQSADMHPATRSMATMTPAAYHPQLRHRASYDGFSKQFPGPIARSLPSVGQSVIQSGAHYQQQLLTIEQQQWEQEDRLSPDGIQPGLHRSRSRSRSIHAHPNPPYRVLHSYNSPAYRNAPIWG